jgi:hypothetical protein
MDEATTIPEDLIAQRQCVNTVRTSNLARKYFFYFLLAYLTLYKGVSLPLFFIDEYLSYFLYPMEFLSITKRYTRTNGNLKQELAKKSGRSW